MAGYLRDLGNGKYQFEVSHGRDIKGKRKKAYRTIQAKGKTPEAQRKYAEKQLALFVAEVEKGEYQEPVRMDFEALFERYLEAKQGEKALAPKTEMRYRQMFNLRIKDYFNRFKIEKITPLDIDGFFIQLREMPRMDGKSGVLSEQTVQHHYRLMQSLFNFAYKKDIIKSNPMDKTEKITVNREERPHYDSSQAAGLLELMDRENVDLKFKAAVTLALASGCRLGELAGLAWSHVNFDNNTIYIENEAQYLNKIDRAKILKKYPNTHLDLLDRNIIIKPPKTKRSKRLIPINPDAMEVLKEYKHYQKLMKMELGSQWKDTDWVFKEETGDLMHPLTITKWFTKFRRKHNLPELTFHGLRHSHGSILLENGEDIATVSKRLGHSSTDTTGRVYLHSSDTVSRRAADGMTIFSKKKKVQDEAN